MRNANRLLYCLTLLKLIVPFLLQNGAYEPHRDEFLYLAEARHMAWGYMEVPPLLSVFGWLTNVFGGGLFWIKLWPSLFGALAFLVVGRMILSLGGRWFALLLGFLPFIFGAYLRMHFLFQPNFLEIFFWTLMAYGLVRYVQSEKNAWLYLAGIAAGLGLMSKYSVLFFAVSLLAGLLLTPERRIYQNRHFWYAFSIAFVLFLPNLIWQWHNGFPVIYHMRELQQSQLQYVSTSSFLTGQLMLNLSCVFTWLVGLVAVGFARAYRPYRFMAWTFVFVIALLAVAHGKSYYSMGAYPVLFGFGAVALEKWTTDRLVYLRYLLVGFALVVGYGAIMIGLPVMAPARLVAHYAKSGLAKKVGALRWEDGEDHPLPQDFADMLGWKEMTAKVTKVYNSMDSAEKAKTMIFCDNYGQAGAVSYYGPRYGLPMVYSTEASFLYWIPDSIARLRNVDAFILVTGDHNEMSHPFIQEFKTAELADSVTNPYARETGDYIILFKGPSDKFRQEFQQKVEHYKEKSTAKGANGKSPIGSVVSPAGHRRI